MRVLVLGDSLGLPRPHRINNYSPDEKELAVHYNEVYSSIIQKTLFEKYGKCNYFEVINRSKRMCTIRDVANEFTDYLFFYEPEIIVLQVGIVDCWFRENRVQIVGVEEFEEHLKRIVSLLELRKKTKLIIVGICPTSEKMDKRYTGANKEIRKYNDIYIKYVNYNNTFYVDMEKYVKPKDIHQYLLPDDCHLNKEGNKLLSRELLNIIEGIYFTVLGTDEHENG